ncbi:cytoplasmic 60S subunit biogenesis factor ZNF622-like [Lycorma delicatula]|uniref:cytoplasmic 60S subunit biogenesis factor ZNF622-like n=1 Tax=Lycorma delicatula TaxID=130591 RepID=UPI003F515393
MNSKYTCIACRVVFNNGEIQRQHYKTDWHRYNLKRKVAELPPVTAEDFQIKVLKQREQDALNEQKLAIYCKVCSKSFQSEKAFSNHLNSKKHKDSLIERSNSVNTSDGSDNQVEKPENLDVTEICCPSTGKVVKTNYDRKDSLSSYETDDSEIEEVDSDEWDEDISDNNPILNNNCLFCSHHSAAFMKNLKHMSVTHSFFIPDADYVTDLKGLLLYLGEKVCQGFLCLWCNDHGRTFHSMEAAQNHMLDKGHCKMLHEGEALIEYADFYDYRSSYPDHNLLSNDDDDDEVDLNLLEETDFQLILPSGATIGHRSLMRYYRQNFDPNRVVVPYKKINRVIAQYRAIGWKETEKEAAARKAKDINYMKRIQKKFSLRMGIKANKFQKHFRHQVNY